MEQTAVEWFVEELKKADYIPKDSSIMDFVIGIAKDKEKKQKLAFAEWFKKSDWEHEMEYLYRHKKTMEVSDMMEIYEEYLKEHEPRT
jgi:hypothetical protein